MSRVFVLRDRETAHRMWDYVKAVAQPTAAAGRPVCVEVGEYTQKRSNDANARYWALLTEIADQAQVEGKRFCKEVWHEHYREQFAPKQESPSGRLVAMSTAQMNKQQFADYMTAVEANAVQTLGIEFASA
jgi:hypothetical protein